MNLFQNFSIKQKLIFINLVTIIPILTLVSLLYIKVDSEMLKGQFIANLQSVAKLTSDYTSPNLMFFDPEGCQEDLAKLESIPSIKGAILFDTKNQRFASYGISLDTIQAKHYSEIQIHDEFVYIYEPVVLKNETQGCLFLLASTDEIESSIHTRILELILYLSLAALSVILLSTLFQNFIANPIKALAEFIKDSLKEDEYTQRIETEQKNEIGALYDGINLLLDKVEHNTFSKKLSTKFLELTNENVIVLNEKEEINFISSSFLNIIQYTEDELIDHKIEQITNDSSFFSKIVHHFQNETYIEFNSTLILKNHTLLPIHVKAFALDEDTTHQYICLIEKL